MARILSSWKEIAQYLGKGVRTVQRWEKSGMPIARPKNGRPTAVVAYTDEIDEWLKGGREPQIALLQKRVAELENENARLNVELSSARSSCENKTCEELLVRSHLLLHKTKVLRLSFAETLEQARNLQALWTSRRNGKHQHPHTHTPIHRHPAQ